MIRGTLPVPSDPEAAQLLHDRIDGLLDTSAVTLSLLVSKEALFGGALDSEAGLALIASEVMSAPADNRDASWTMRIAEVIRSVSFLRVSQPTLVGTREQEDAVLRLILALASSEETVPNFFIKYTYDNSIKAYAYRISNPGILELVSARPGDWKPIADLMIESGLDHPEGIKLVLDGIVPTSLSVGIL